MDIYSEVEPNDKSNGPLTTQNGGPKHRPAGVDNPAFRLYQAYDIPMSNEYNDIIVNHSVYPGDEDSGVNNEYFSNNSGSFQGRFASSHQLPSIGDTLWGATAKRGNNTSQTLSRRSAPAAIGRANPSLPISKTFHKKSGHFSKHHPKSEKSSFITCFDIETDKVSSYQYRPGEEFTGTVTIMVRKKMEIRFVDMVVTGQGQITVQRSIDGLSQTRRETYLHKEKCIIGAHDVLMNSMLSTGYHTSQFRIHLPEGLPSTLHHEDAASGFKFDITYTIKVRICDDVGAKSSRRTTAHGNRVRVVLEKQIHFNVQRGFDLNRIPDALLPIAHTKQVYLSCNHRKAAIVSVNLDRAVFLAGDDMRMQLQISLPASQNVKEILCSFQEFLTITPKSDPLVFTLNKIIQKDPCSTEEQLANQKINRNIVDITMPTRMDLISRYSLGNSKIKVDYFLEVELIFTPAGGKLSFKIPVGIGPCADPIYAEKTVSKKAIPLFNKPSRFPFFSSKTFTEPARPQTSTPRRSASVQVTTKYSNGIFARCFLCCMGPGEP